MYRGPAGVVALNEVLQARLNPTTASLSIAYGEHTFRVGDKVMAVHNNYDKGPTGVFNGDLGRVVRVELEIHQVWVEFVDDAGTFTVGYDSHKLDELMLYYAYSIYLKGRVSFVCWLVI
jgi:exodeoxyribonuclease V alpha subunit